MLAVDEGGRRSGAWRSSQWPRIPVQVSRWGPALTASNCSYSGSGLERLNLNLIQMSPDMATMYRAMCAEKDHTGLTGLGDISCWYSDRHEELQVLKGTTFISIELHKGGNPTEAIKGVMKKALAHLED